MWNDGRVTYGLCTILWYKWLDEKGFPDKSLIFSNLHPSSHLLGLSDDSSSCSALSLRVNRCMWDWSWTTSLPNDLCRATSMWCGMDCWWENDSRHGPKCGQPYADISVGEEMRGEQKLQVWRIRYLTFTFTERQLKQTIAIKSTDFQHSYVTSGIYCLTEWCEISV